VVDDAAKAAWTVTRTAATAAVFAAERRTCTCRRNIRGGGIHGAQRGGRLVARVRVVVTVVILRGGGHAEGMHVPDHPSWKRKEAGSVFIRSKGAPRAQAGLG
jgi:hypothetical protein